jgi:hypothetical protein
MATTWVYAIVPLLKHGSWCSGCGCSVHADPGDCPHRCHDSWRFVSGRRAP